jgi:hypothetical protein
MPGPSNNPDSTPPIENYDDLTKVDSSQFSIESLFQECEKIAVDAEIMWGSNHTGGVSSPLGRRRRK